MSDVFLHLLFPRVCFYAGWVRLVGLRLAIHCPSPARPTNGDILPAIYGGAGYISAHCWPEVAWYPANTNADQVSLLVAYRASRG